MNNINNNIDRRDVGAMYMNNPTSIGTVLYGARTPFDQTDECIRSTSAFIMEKSEFDDKCLCDIAISPDKSTPNFQEPVKETVRLTKVDISDNDELLTYIKTDEVLEQLYNLCKDITDGFILVTNWNEYNIQGSLKSAFEYCNKMNYSLDKMPMFICYNRNHACKTMWSANTINFTTVNYFVNLPNLDTRILTTDKTFVKMCKKIFCNNKFEMCEKLFGGNDKED